MPSTKMKTGKGGKHRGGWSPIWAILVGMSTSYPSRDIKQAVGYTSWGFREQSELGIKCMSHWHRDKGPGETTQREIVARENPDGAEPMLGLSGVGGAAGAAQEGPRQREEASVAWPAPGQISVPRRRQQP